MRRNFCVTALTNSSCALAANRYRYNALRHVQKRRDQCMSSSTVTVSEERSKLARSVSRHASRVTRHELKRNRAEFLSTKGKEIRPQASGQTVLIEEDYF